jgi:predicted small lipoprotein YifL
MNSTTKTILILMMVLAAAACSKPGPLDPAADQIAQATLKTTYANPSNLIPLEERAQKEWGMDAQKLIKACAVAALQYMKMSPDQAGKIAAQLSNPDSGNDTSRDLAAGFSNHLQRCLTKPSAYDVGK